MADWHFRTKIPSEKERNPVGGEYFDEEAIERPAQALVREVIQNSLDANANGGDVSVRFYVSGQSGALSADRAARWLGGAWEHYRAPDSGLKNVLESPPPCRFLVVEDRSTIGLEGDPSEVNFHPGVDKKHKNHFYAFFRAEGVSENSGGRGKWGVGKTVFPRSSRVNTLFGLTMRKSDEQRQRLLMGQAILRFHWVGQVNYAPDGVFGELDKDSFVLPIANAQVVDEFCRDFSVKWRGNPGLSVVVPYYHDDITADAIISSVAREYFFPILTGKLTVVVESPDLANKTRTLNANSLIDSLDSDKGDIRGELRSVITFAAEEVVTAPPAQRQSLKDAGIPPDWNTSLLTGTNLDELAHRFTRGQSIAIRVPIRVRKSSGITEDSYFDVFMRLDTKGRGYAPIFIRNGIIVPKALEYRVRGHRLLALVIIEHEPLATLLGDAETPAHTQWSSQTQNFREKYEYGNAYLDFVKSAPKRIAEHLTSSGSARDRIALADFFPRDGESDGLESMHEQERRKEGDDVTQPTMQIPTVLPPFEVEHLHGGFRVRRNAKVASCPPRLEIVAAYDRTRGNPLSKYDRADFQLDAMRKTLSGVVERSCQDNRLVVDVVHPDFRIEVADFDLNRDLYVRVRPMEPENDSTS